MKSNPKNDAPDSRFCDQVERMGVRCYPNCWDELCLMEGKEQRLYQGFGIRDKVIIATDKAGRPVVETDIEVPYRTKYPSPRATGQMDQFIEELKAKEKVLTVALSARLPEGVIGPWYHDHYRENALPDLASLHVHVRYKAKDMPEAVSMARKLQDAIDGEWLTRMIQ